MEAKQELQQSHSASGGSSGRGNNDDGVGLSGFVSLVRKLSELKITTAVVQTYIHTCIPHCCFPYKRLPAFEVFGVNSAVF